jgi:hypothetical protein
MYKDAVNSLFTMLHLLQILLEIIAPTLPCPEMARSSLVAEISAKVRKTFCWLMQVGLPP